MSVEQSVQSELWEFGISNTPDSVVIAHDQGEVGLFERTKKINLAVSDKVKTYSQALIPSYF